MDRLYVIVDSALSPGLKMAQACHALRLFGAEHAETEKNWYENSSNIVILEHDSLPRLSEELGSIGLELSSFHEPDLDDAMTAVCVEPKAWRYLSNIRLAS